MTLKSRQVTAKLIVQSAVSSAIALKSHTVWYGVSPTDRVLLFGLSDLYLTPPSC